MFIIWENIVVWWDIAFDTDIYVMICYSCLGTLLSVTGHSCMLS